MKILCPNCERTVPAQDIVLDSGWAKCAACDEVFSLVGLLPGYAPKVAGKASGSTERPFDARAVVKRDDGSLVVHLPAQGMRGAAWGLLAFSAFWLVFIAFWTAGALGFAFFGGGPFNAGDAIFAAFSIPFWMAGFAMLGAVVWMSRGSRSVYLDASRMVTELRCMHWRRTRSYSREQVQCAREGAAVMSANSGQPNSAYHPYCAEIVTTQGVFKIPCANPAEREWLVGEINGFLAQVPFDPMHREVPRDSWFESRAAY